MKKFRSFEDASRWAVTLELKNNWEWRRYIKENQVPDDIPRKPEYAYKKRGTWKSWGEFLGTTRASQVEVLNNSTVIFAIVNSLDDPRNVFGVISSPLGEQDLLFKKKKAGYFYFVRPKYLRQIMWVSIMSCVDLSRSVNDGDFVKIVYQLLPSSLVCSTGCRNISNRSLRSFAWAPARWRMRPRPICWGCLPRLNPTCSR